MREHTGGNAATPTGGHWLHRSLVKQFGRPQGLVGRLAGWSMAHRPSNKQRNRWTVDLLQLKPGEHVLEIGFGPGLALVHAAEQVGETGRVVGIDPSEVMVAHAQRRNRAAIAAGQMKLDLGYVERLTKLEAQFDAIMAINTIGFWPDPTARLAELRERLRPGGRLAVTVQPRSPGATAATSERVRRELEERFKITSFSRVASHWLPLKPPAVCVIGHA
jgi:ubiquinone/menaquinone biosynthesis C-methylase UbiE